ncbi:MAG: glycosyltransferase family 4 protein [Treponemataceae bacterium]|nr:glycosyltransferase family 4 protein [Treponemataceae bacterium]
MRLAVDCRMLGSGGIGSYLSALLPYLTAEADCLLFGDEALLPQYAQRPGTAVVPCKITPFSLRELLCFPAELARQINACDALYSPYCNVPSGTKVPFFPTIHDVVFLDVPGLASKAGVWMRKRLYRHAVRRAAAVFTVSEFSAERIRFHLRPRAEVAVTYNAAPEWFSAPGAPAAAPVKKEDFILFVGNIKKHKGLGVLLEAFAAARRAGLSSRLVIVGNAEHFRTADKAVLEQISRAPDGAIEFTGRISDAKLKELYQAAKLLVQPSLYEGFGMPPLEAMTLGTRAVISDIPVFREIYRDFPAAFFKAGDAADLAEKLVSEAERAGGPIPAELPDRYSFRRTSDIILSTIRKHI